MARRNLLLIFTLIMSIALIASACSRTQTSLVEGKVNVVTSFFPLYDLTSKVGGEHVHVINLTPTGVDAHDWSPKSRDMQNIKDADLFVYLGAGFEGWVDDTLKSLNKDAKVTPLESSKGIEFILAAEEHGEEGHDDHEHEAEGHDDHEHEAEDSHADDHAHEAEGSHADDHAHEAEDDHGHDHSHGEYDPHVWLDPLNAKIIAFNIKNALVQADPAHQADYDANYNKLAERLDELHGKFKTELSRTSKKEIVVTHQSFGYLAKQYGLQQMPIMGLSADAEPTAQTMKAVLRFIEEHDVKYIFFEELVSDKMAKTLANDAKVETLVLNPLEGLTDAQAKAGDDYFSMMENNLNNLIKALK